MLLVEDRLQGQELDVPPRPPIKRRTLLLRVMGDAEGDEEAAADFGELTAPRRPAR
jgi:hypothetical protein